MGEPSIFDYIRSLFDPNISIDIHEFVDKHETQHPNKKNGKISNRLGKRIILIGVVPAFIGQRFLEPDFFHIEYAVFLYLIAFFLIWRGIKRDKNKVCTDIRGERKKFNLNCKKYPLMISIFLLIISFILFSSNTFNLLNLSFWISGILLLIYSFWEPVIKITRKPQKLDMLFIVICLISLSIIVFFRLYLLNEIPGEMFSDHAEKLLDVLDIINGKFPIFFERNTGREPFQFYLTALFIKLINVELSFISLKIGTVLSGLLTLLFIFRIGKEVSNKWEGLIAVFFAGIGYWPNIISRVGLRYALYPLFVALVLYYLIRSLNEKNSNLLIICGLFLGLGLNGYSSFRIMPFLVFIIFMVYILVNRVFDEIEQSVFALLIISITAFVIFLPVLRYSLGHPGNFSYRMLSRLTPIERSFDESPIIIFIKNFFDSILMLFFRNGQIWVHSVPNRPALGATSASLFFIGLIVVLHKIKYQNKWEFVVLLISVPILMMPSILSLAYPAENPSLNRSAGAYVPIFLIIGIGFVYIKDTLIELLPKKISKIAAVLFCIAIGLTSIQNNYQLVFLKYRHQFDENSWNTSEIGAVIQKFVQKGGENDHAFVVPFPHWVDTRLVGFNAGFPGKDYALSKNEISEIPNDGEEKIFIFKPDDLEVQNSLEQYFPGGKSSIYYSDIPGKDFLIYTVE